MKLLPYSARSKGLMSSNKTEKFALKKNNWYGTVTVMTY